MVAPHIVGGVKMLTILDVKIKVQKFWSEE